MTTTRTIAAEHVDRAVQQIAEVLSDFRKIRAILWEHQTRLNNVRAIRSSQQELDGDWNDACYFVVLTSVQTYLENRYLDGSTLDEDKPGTSMLISEKAKRIWKQTGDSDAEANWFRAKMYVRMFYDNILRAVTTSDELATLGVLEAFQFSKAASNRYFVINCFEAALAICFLDKSVVSRLLETPDLYDFSIVNVTRWPSNTTIPASCAKMIEYNSDSKTLSCLGIMTEAQLHDLVSAFPAHTSSINQLYEHSRLFPCRNGVL